MHVLGRKISRSEGATASEVATRTAPPWSVPRGLWRAGIILPMAVMLVLNASKGDASSQCKTGSLQVTSISQDAYEEVATLAGESACVTAEGSGLTVCQLIPVFPSDSWIVVAQAPEGGSVSGSAFQLQVYNVRNCLFTAGTPLENTDSRWVEAVTLFDTPATLRPLDFIAIAQIGPATQTTATACPLDAPDEPLPCQEWSGWD